VAHEANHVRSASASDPSGANRVARSASFSATNAALWRLAITVERGEGGGTVLEAAKAVDPAKAGNRTRRAALFLDVGRGLAREPRMRREAVQETMPMVLWRRNTL